MSKNIRRSGIRWLTLAFAAVALLAGPTTAQAGDGAGRTRRVLGDTKAPLEEIVRVEIPRHEPREPWLESTEAVCGDGIPDLGETCDDANTAPGDGCSSTCQIEPGWDCTEATPPTTEANVVQDPSLENGTPNADWPETGTPLPPICDASCGIDIAFDGDWYAWFGGFATPSTQTLGQTLVIPSGATDLTFELNVSVCDSDNDILTLSIDGNQVFTTAGPCVVHDYETQTIDLATAPGGPYNDDTSHTLLFASNHIAMNGTNTNQFVDLVQIIAPVDPPIPGDPSVCQLAKASCLDEAFEPGPESFGDWTIFNTGANDMDWGTTDDGICGTVNWTAGNYTGGSGEAACADSDKAGAGVMDAYLCSPELDLSLSQGTVLDFLYNYQIFALDGNDRFEVLVGTSPPTSLSVNFYTPIFLTTANAGTFEGTGASESLSLAASEGQSSVWFCFRYLADFDWYAEVDDVQVNADTCDGSNTPLETSPVAASVPLLVDRTETEAATLDLTWEFTLYAETYRVIQGDLSTLNPGGVTPANTTVAACDIVGLSTSIPEPAGNAFVLVAGENFLGVGPLGNAADNGVPGAPRTASTTCP